MNTLRRLARQVGRAALRWGLNADNMHMDRNGEAWLMARVLRGASAPVAVDIGMNQGAWSARAVAVAPGLRVIGFEPVPRFAETVRARALPGVEVTCAAIGREAGEITVYEVGEGGRSVSLGGSRKAETPHVVPCLTLDSALADRGAERLDLVKVDTDGHDFPALEGMAGTLRRLRPVVQFEYSRFWLPGRHQLGDAVRLLDGLGYRTAYLLPCGLDADKYSSRAETYMSCNMVAVPSERWPLR